MYKITTFRIKQSAVKKTVANTDNTP